MKKSTKPIVLYGTGNACERIIAELKDRDIKISGIFASDGFVRDRSFAGFKVMSYSECREKFGGMIVLVCFGSHLFDVIENIKRIDGEQELYMPDLPVIGDGLFTTKYMDVHKSDITWLVKNLADAKSIEVLENLIQYRLTGRIKFLFDAETDDSENRKLLGLASDEVYADLGAYTGDTVDEFIKETSGNYKRIYAFEPEERNFRKLFENTRGLENICIVNAAVGDLPGEIMFTHGVGRGGAAGKGKTRSVSRISLDTYFEDEFSDNLPTYIKMDLEGAEGSALKGAEKLIAERKPKLLISAYHRIDDFWEIPKQILSINPEYKIYLRKSPCLPCWEVNYYCI